MGFLDKLSSILKISIPKLASVHLLSDNKSQKTVINGNVVNINIEKLDIKSLKELKEILPSYVNTESGLIIQDTSLERLQDYNEVKDDSSTQCLLSFFRDKIPEKDLEILGFSIYAKKLYDRDSFGDKVKIEIIQKYGERGKNICNLYSAGYFETQIKPLFETLSDKEKFNQIYELIVKESPYAIFISRRMSENDALNEVIKRMEIDEKYGVKQLNIHGIGQENVEKIEFILEKIKDRISKPAEIKKEENFITAKIDIVHNHDQVTDISQRTNL